MGLNHEKFVRLSINAADLSDLSDLSLNTVLSTIKSPIAFATHGLRYYLITKKLDFAHF